MACDCRPVDWVLIPLKIVVFLTFAAVSSLLPFLNIHMKYLGFTVHETAVICSVLPLTQILSFPLINNAVKKLGSYRSLLIYSLVFILLFVSALLIFPFLPPPEHRQHSLHLVCGTKIKPWIIVDKCGEERTCSPVQGNDIINLQFTACSVQCPNHGADLQEPVNVADLCFDDEVGRVCHVVEVNNTLSENFTFGLYLNSPEDRSTDCYYPVDAVTWHQLVFHHMSCPIIIPHLNKGNCSLKCRFQEVNDVTSTLSFDNEECVYVGYKRWLFFSLYLVLRCFIHLLVAVILLLLENSLNVATEFADGRYTMLNVYNSLATAVFPPLVGLVVDINHSDYSYAVYVFNILVTVVIVSVVVLDVQLYPLPRNGIDDLKQLSCHAEYVMLVIIMFWIGTMWGYLETFLFWYLLDFNTPKYILGLTITAGSLSGIPLLKKYRPIAKKFGCANILCLSLFMYCGRYICYSLITDGWWSVLLAVTDLLTYHLMSVASSLYCSYVIPRNLIGSGGSLLKVVHYSIGRGTAAIVGGGIMGTFGAPVTFRVLGASCGILGLLYLLAVYLLTCKRSLENNSENDSKIEAEIWEIREERINGAATRDTNSESDKNEETSSNLLREISDDRSREELEESAALRRSDRGIFGRSGDSVKKEKPLVAVHRQNTS
ncbi:major facilitator superfamily domain-containing protein 6-like protein B [Centruroides sculpturatus]|uniref:major facilitator superfamily domain-containing protein 6-like protein B n=1 Tax=Centruroides sculpturatus TaxID=218467 RepID=UPI000C6D0A3D|nr:major facilitator superfamily domain-containing protein 6-like protein B [Centruroides sculpturatus]XP_023239584.1 major facilitator superfamily domain-containing protein 6-like protein B [Centruroides sculpturatus]XP_023239585.1 major facilitator superfamily domain-containing protein 6-like protein B [Centruroides sculpturatus]XP_023239586.1 major facilitator superfamily domain-containing protein 6-like protein B [Centruroides sculpturatus]XP_023239587.1 major facilitator superfamily domain